MIASFWCLARGLAALILWGASVTVMACNEATPCRQEMTIGGQQFVFYEAKAASLEQIRDLVIVVHGQHGSPVKAARTGLEVARRLGRSRTTLVLAPEFLETTRSKKPATSRLFWSGRDNWRRGDLSVNTGGSQVSSFEAMDILIERYLNQMGVSDIRSLVIIGHSAGGQYVQRYAIGTDLDRRYPSIQFIFGVANPSSYMYLNNQRPASDASSTFVVPSDSRCAWNAGHFGFEARNAYMSRYDTAELTQHYLQRAVIYALGDRDSDPAHPQLGKSPCSNLQGEHRLDRGLKYFRYLETFFPGHRHTLAVVEGVGHDSSKMLTSKAFLRRLTERIE